MRLLGALVGSAVGLATSQATALRVTTEVQKWTDQLSHNIPAWETHCLNELLRREGLDAELLRIFGINADDPQVVAIRRYCESHQSAARSVPGLWPAAGPTPGGVGRNGHKKSQYPPTWDHALSRDK